jgi:phospholipase/carboxylesterase
MTNHFRLQRADQLEALYGPSFGAELFAPPQELDESPCAATIRTLHPAGAPVQLYVPEAYEPRYPYPLMLWLHGAGGSEQELAPLMGQISTRNCFGLALRGPRAGGGEGYDWHLSSKGFAALEEDLYQTVCNLRREYHVHSERVVVAGFDSGATLALRLLLSHPGWYGGAVAIAGRFPYEATPLPVNPELREKRVLLLGGSRDPLVPATEILLADRSLEAAGIDVTTLLDDAGHAITSRMLAHVNRWLMQGVCAPVC